ncbi:torsin-1A-interacting protein 2 isoform X2 [Salmo trutta]|uniref:torsin-1A-interacting protein 2 isoform X2 n=1 Tax=Salmo trutta TaxID=8032 RepID=UPI00113201F0|nr:torsin-1A-interacting protein 2 isoform X2 [Salmo trutta]
MEPSAAGMEQPGRDPEENTTAQVESSEKGSTEEAAPAEQRTAGGDTPAEQRTAGGDTPAEQRTAGGDTPAEQRTAVKKETEPSAAGMEQPGRDPEEKNTTAQVESSEKGSTEEDAPAEQRTAGGDTPAEQRTAGGDTPAEQRTAGGDTPAEQRTAGGDTPAEQRNQNQDSSLPPSSSSGQGSQNLEDLDTELKKETEPSAAGMEQPGRDPEEKNTTAQVESSEKGSTEEDKDGAVEPQIPLTIEQRATKKREDPSCKASMLMLAGLLVLLLAVAAMLFNPESPPDHTAFNRTETFHREMKKMEALFPGQRSELWRRSRIHLERHLQTARPTEPVSLMLTAGRRGEKTLHCLALRLASAFSSALNASSVHIDGASKTGQDSDQVKLDIDTQLRGAFEGGQPVAVIHRFEELPPGSTIIFYRYCDHENAAYKEVFLLFTVLLGGEEELPASLGLSAVEEMVDDHLQDKFLSSDQPAAFDMMDLDKFSGLWSRISHLVLPVAVEERIEQSIEQSDCV